MEHACLPPLGRDDADEADFGGFDFGTAFSNSKNPVNHTKSSLGAGQALKAPEVQNYGKKKPLWSARAKIYYHSQTVNQKRLRFVGTIKVNLLYVLFFKFGEYVF